MKTAQRLFEGVDIGGETVGLITYMRTDSVQLSGEALGASRRLIGQRFGEAYLPEKPRQYKTKTKNAQEAHEAIRPTDLFRIPSELRGQLDDDQRRLYDLIWKRTVASQMAAALLDRVTADIGSADGVVGLRATGQTVAFDGFLKLYQEGRDDPTGDEDEDGAMLPPLAVGDPMKQRSVTPLQHFTEPPPRYSEASLVKKMEELGIGRPSTYASIISVLQNRSYVRLEQKRFVPEDKGWLVNAFLVEKFGHWVEYDFTAQLENQLDDVAGGSRFWKDVLREFWVPFAARLAEVGEQRQREVIDALDHALGPLLFTGDGETDPRLCPRCGEGRLGPQAQRLRAVHRLLALPRLQLHARLHHRRQRGRRRRGAALGPAARASTRPTPRRSGSRSAGSAPTCSAAPGPRPSAARCRPASLPDDVDLATGAASCSSCRARSAAIPRPGSRSWRASTATGRSCSSRRSTCGSSPATTC